MSTEGFNFIFNDGGRALAGFKGSTGDCVTRAIAIATGKPYREVYDALNGLAKKERPRKGRNGKKRPRSSARTGVNKPTSRAYLAALGWKWTPTMGIGTGCKVHLRADELPSGVLIVAVSKHLCAVIDGVVYDTHDPRRDGTRCVYGYWQKPTLDEATATWARDHLPNHLPDPELERWESYVKRVTA